MRQIARLAICALLAAFAAPVYAQDVQGACHSVSPTRRVEVAKTAGPSVRGTLLCISADEVVLAQNGHTVSTGLGDVRWIRTRPDPVWDGAVKGAVVPLVMWAVFCRDCDVAPMLRGVAGYALIGLAWDSLQRNTTTIYAAGRIEPAKTFSTATGPSASIKWRIAF